MSYLQLSSYPYNQMSVIPNVLFAIVHIPLQSNVCDTKCPICNCPNTLTMENCMTNSVTFHCSKLHIFHCVSISYFVVAVGIFLATTTISQIYCCAHYSLKDRRVTSTTRVAQRKKVAHFWKPAVDVDCCKLGASGGPGKNSKSLSECPTPLVLC